MGVTFGQSFINAQVILPRELFLMEKNQAKADQLKSLTPNPLYTRPDEFISKMDLLIFAVKPQDFEELANNVLPFLKENQLILSIMAGITISTIKKALNTNKVVRAMPNLPAQVGKGMTVFTTSQAVNKSEVVAVHNLLNTTGKTLYAEEESMIDAATAVSGSGPAFVYYFMDSMINAAREMGFSNSEANLLVRQTVWGSISLLDNNTYSCQEWITKVSSKGGTTEAAMGYFGEIGMNKLVEAGLGKAQKRAQDLSIEK